MELLNKATTVFQGRQLGARGFRRPLDLLITFVLPHLILLGSFIITAKSLRSPVKCLNTGPTAPYREFVESQCWVQGPFLLNLFAENDITDPNPVDRLSYYAYLPYIFFMASVILFTPHFILSILVKPFSIKFEAMFSGTEILTSAIADAKAKAQVKDRIYYHLNSLTDDKYYISVFAIFRYVNLIFLLVLLPLFFSIAFRANFYKLGGQAAFFFYKDNDLQVKKRFPITGLCIVKIREFINSDNQHNVFPLQCNLATNFITAKVYGFVWFLVFVVAMPLAIVDTVYTMTNLCCFKRFNSETLALFLLKESTSSEVYQTIIAMHRAQRIRKLKSDHDQRP